MYIYGSRVRYLVYLRTPFLLYVCTRYVYVYDC